MYPNQTFTNGPVQKLHKKFIVQLVLKSEKFAFLRCCWARVDIDLSLRTYKTFHKNIVNFKKAPITEWKTLIARLRREN